MTTQEPEPQSQHPHEQYAKKYLADLLDEVAKVQLGYEVLAEARRVDVYVVRGPQPVTSIIKN